MSSHHDHSSISMIEEGLAKPESVFTTGSTRSTRWPQGMTTKKTPRHPYWVSAPHSGPLAPTESTNNDLGRDSTSKTEARLSPHLTTKAGQPLAFGLEHTPQQLLGVLSEQGATVMLESCSILACREMTHVGVEETLIAHLNFVRSGPHGRSFARLGSVHLPGNARWTRVERSRHLPFYDLKVEGW
ncbi:hypothetical protein CRG98_019907 [Punica granatum]|uniref:Uncharacterized protein n=1 Tax=Punica granatum TaxID=22663 RepID=A0A2I0JTY1_PUNGR|nr:hypothetical protein CRG98_019907 [Punica granatum]